MNLKLQSQFGGLVKGFRGVLFALSVLLLLVPGLFAAPADGTLAWRDLINHPERWPATTKVTGTLNFGKDVIKAGTALKIMEVLPKGARLIAPQGFTFVAEPADCDLLQAANTFWSALTPAQRNLTVQQIQRDWSLLPTRVAINGEFTYGNLKLPVGTEMLVLNIAGDEVGMYHEKTHRSLLAKISETDLMDRSRQLVGMPKEKRPDRMGEILSRVAVDASGKPATVKSSQYYVVYVAASTCPRCEIFTPQLIEHLHKSLAGRNDVAFVTEPTDTTTPPMLAYMKRKEIPWPTVPVECKQVNHSFGITDSMEIPGMIVLDRFGNPLLSTSKIPGAPLDAANAALAKLDTVLKPVD